MRVLISGAGIAGPILAYHLSKGINAQVTVLERSEKLLAQGQNIDIRGTAMKVIRNMGLYEELKKRNTTEIGCQFVTGKGKPIASFPVWIEGVETKCPSPTSEYEILRGDLADMLYQSTIHDKNIQYKFSVTVEKVLENNENSVKVLLSNGEEIEYDIVVAADGQWSKLRKQCFDAEDLQVIDKNMYIGYWTAPRDSTDTDWWRIYHATKSRLISLRPDPYGTIRPMFSKMPTTEEEKEKWRKISRSHDRSAQIELLKEEFSDAGYEADRLMKSLDKAEDFYFQAVSQIRMKRWSVNRVVCIGDAAYAPTPLTGMGTPLAILGAYVLAGELSLLKKDENPITALKEYENAFKPFVAKIQEVPSFVPGIMHPKSWFGIAILHFVFWTLCKIFTQPFIARKFPEGEDDEDYKLKEYPILEQLASKNKTTPTSEKV
ncbi:hypothetical protein L7F22_039390 [Adiantum nelumboides]|nr:hypothetical protein [Adiantum nelumboides]